MDATSYRRYIPIQLARISMVLMRKIHLCGLLQRLLQFLR